MLSLRIQRSFRLVFAAIFLTGCLDQASAASIEYCSGLNTADSNKNSSIYQSNGLCSDFCKSSYAFAVVQDDGCWCSNYVPGSTTSGCTQTCPGYPLELCGGSGVYGYIALGNTPSGTKGGSSTAASSTSTSTSTSTSPSSTTPQQVTVTATPSAVTIVDTLTTGPISQSSSTSTSVTSTTTQDATTPTPTLATTSPSPTSTSSSSSSSIWTPTPVTSLETVTGQVHTVTITPTSPPNSALVAPVSKNKSSSGISTGGAVGLTIGLVALVAIVSAIVYFCLKKRRKDNEAERLNADTSRHGSSAGLGGPIPSRTMSENSRYVLGTNGREVVETWEDSAPGSRKSRLVPVDPRLDPFSPVYQRASDNKSRESVNTIRDDHDYSRRVHQQGPILRATNPDT
ncbi:Cell wall integrity and stress response component [Lachnellula subtilissima]|uniref:Cell wall integrity and stress response component n=1 Tax=Lachnellula subtilissima TaxID=602034 RepID=A0A8H8RL19_9HELO|nr:Cell wall integrity and stress response component [Lachnellula subtilissima]